MSIDLQRYQQLHAPEEAPVERGTFAHEWVLPVMGGFGVALTLAGLGYLVASWWVS